MRSLWSDFFELVESFASDALSRGVGRDEFGKLFLQFGKFVLQGVGGCLGHD